MSRPGILILLGVLVILTPFSGLPVAMRTLLEVILGACVLGIGLILRFRDAQNAATRTPTVEPHPTIPPHDVSPI